MKFKRKYIAGGVLALIIVLEMVMLGLHGCTKGFIYHPRKDFAYEPKRFGMDFEDVYFTTSDNKRLNGWYFPVENPKLTVLFLHGNGGNMGYYLPVAQFCREHQLNCLLFDYRGYGRSQGKPNEEGTYRDARAGWDWLVHEKGIEPGTILIYGKSLGGSIAAELATHVKPGGVWLDSTFTSVEAVGKKYWPAILVKLFKPADYPTIKFVKEIHSPLLITHGPEDQVISYEFGVELYKAANEPKLFIETTGGHNETAVLSNSPASFLHWLESLEQVTK